jgi:hypothetical protein
MDLIKISSGSRVVVKQKATKKYFLDLMEKARGKFGLKSENNPNGFSWPNAHKNSFYAGGCEYKLEFLGGIDFDL